MEEWKNIFKGLGISLGVLLLWTAFFAGLLFVLGLAEK